MKYVSHRKIQRTVEVKIHVDPHLVPLIKSKLDLKTERGYRIIKFCRNIMSEKLDMYEFKIYLFDNVDSEEFFLFIKKFNMTL